MEGSADLDGSTVEDFVTTGLDVPPHIPHDLRPSVPALHGWQVVSLAVAILGMGANLRTSRRTVGGHLTLLNVAISPKATRRQIIVRSSEWLPFSSAFGTPRAVQQPPKRSQVSQDREHPS